MAQTPRLIDGIVLTKFDTIDDKVNTGHSGTGRAGPEAALAAKLSVTWGTEEGPGVDWVPLFPFQVGAAISMTYITSKPIVFVGTGQTYCDLRSLNAKAVVAALMKA